ncbi:IclR family transcriptional regulator [Paenibacillus sp. J2TS4]|uniref:IclR family transcriptional regulator n=1 Tax=Paenibacillus sp. J2TS4 TaxID=2807194 RepID=UPI001B0BF3A6|nr:IclR family transcriptional regulator [Paenibacillus sp. J2TS4]GIP35303.1 IclR family transcriptional regulator [Paenibacillus sp. J2TS4]
MAKPKKDYSVPAIEKAITILNCISRKERMNINELHTELNIPKTTVFVIVNTLERHSLIEKQEDGKYILGHGVLYWGMNYYQQNDIKQIAHPHLIKLVAETPFTAHLAIMANYKAVYIDKCEGDGFVRFATIAGQALPLHLSGVGKALASGLPDKEITAAIDVIVGPSETRPELMLDKLMEDVQFVRQHGYSIEDEQMEEGIRCIGAPVFDENGRVIAAISLTALSKDLPAIKFQAIGETIKETALRISQEMGYSNR